jgi:multiple sugar transport system permease protein
MFPGSVTLESVGVPRVTAIRQNPFCLAGYWSPVTAGNWSTSLIPPYSGISTQAKAAAIANKTAPATNILFTNNDINNSCGHILLNGDDLIAMFPTKTPGSQSRLTYNDCVKYLSFLLLTGVLLLFPIGPAFCQTIVVHVGGSLDWRIPDKNAADPRGRADRAIVDEFEREHPNILLENSDGLQIAGPAAESNLLMAFAGGTAPDVVYVNFRSMQNYIDQGFLSPLNTYIAQDPELLQRINPVIRNVITVNGSVYAIPYGQVVQALYYRRDMFQSAGIDPNSPPKTWDDFYDDCARITNHKKGIWGFEWPNSADGDAYWWCNLLWQAGGDVVKKNASGQYVAAFDSPQGVEALNFYSKMLSAPYISPIDHKLYYGVANNNSSSYNDTDRTRGKVAMWFAYQSNVVANTADTSINPSLIGIAPMPAGPAGTANEINATMWGISSQIKDPRVRAAAWEFIKFMASDKADQIRTQALVEAGLGNMVNPVSLEKYGYADQVTSISKTWIATNKSLFAHGHPEPHNANMQEIYNIIGQPLQAISLNPKANPESLLRDAAQKANDKLIGYVPPRVLARRRAIAWSVLALLIVACFSYLAWWIPRVVAAASAKKEARIKSGLDERNLHERRSATMAVLFMAPAVALVAIWSYYPLAKGLEIAFQDYKIVLGAHWVGLDNFIDVFTSDTFWIGLWNALVYTVLSLSFGFCLPIGLALMLNEIPVGTVFFRTVYYLPAVTSGLVIAFLWKLFEDSSPTGLLNTLIGKIHLPPQMWLGDPKWAMIAIVAPAIWAAAGPGCIIYLAALKGIPGEMYEAADIDGAGVISKVFRITVPTLRPLIIINLIGATIGAFQASSNILIMTGGGPLYSTQTIGLEIFYNAFLYLKFGYATAAAWVMGTLLLGFTIYQLQIVKNLRFSAARA